jgi:predicted RNA-binding protein (virulence factor B family)
MAHSGNGVVAVFRNKSQQAIATVQLPLMPAGKYLLHSIITNKDLGVFNKSDWARGVSIEFSGSHIVEVLEVISTS